MTYTTGSFSRRRFFTLIVTVAIIATLLTGLSPYTGGVIANEPTVTWVIPSIYAGITDRFFDGALLAVNVGGEQAERGTLRGGLWGFIDRDGNEIMPPVYNFVCNLWIDEWHDLVKVGTGDAGPLFHRDDGVWVVDGLNLYDALFSDNVRFGLIDAEGNEVVPLKYSWIGGFSEGLAAVLHSAESVRTFSEGYHANLSNVGGLWGFIDTEGNEVVPPRYDNVWSFAGGRAAVSVGGEISEWGWQTGGLWGFIDTEGNEVVPLIYDQVRAFSEGMAAVRYGDLWGFVDTYGNEIIPPQFGWVGNFSNGFATIADNGPETGLWGLIDKQGNQVVPPKYSIIYNFQDGLAMTNIGGWVHFTDGGGLIAEGGLWGLIDTEGSEVVPPVYDGIQPLGEGLWATRTGTTAHPEWGTRVPIGGLLGIVDKEGNEVVPPKYDQIMSFQEGLAAVRFGGETDERGLFFGGLWGFIDTAGNEVIPPVFTAAHQFRQGLAWVNAGGESARWWGDATGGQWGLIDTEGNEVVQPRFDAINHWWLQDMFPVRIGDFWGVIDVEGNEIIPLKFDDVRRFGDGLWTVSTGGRLNEWGFRIGGLWGIIDSKGNETVPSRFDEIVSRRDSLITAKIGDRYFILDAEGREVMPEHYVLEGVQIFADGLVAVKVEGLWGVIRVE